MRKSKNISKKNPHLEKNFYTKTYPKKKMIVHYFILIYIIKQDHH